MMGYGDELMAVGDARRLRMAFPSAQIVIPAPNLQTSWSREQAEVFQDNPYIAAIPEPQSDRQVVVLRNFPGCRPYIRSISDKKVWFANYEAHAGELFFSAKERQSIEKSRARFGDAVLVHPNVKRAYTSVNKDWEYGASIPARWNALVNDMQRDLQIVVSYPASPDVRYLDSSLNAQAVITSSFRDLCCLIASVKAVVCTEGGVHHAAAAMGKPAVVIFGGRTSPKTTGYSQHHNVYIDAPESPCGMLSDCSHCARCMSSIGVDLVAAALRSVVAATAK